MGIRMVFNFVTIGLVVAIIWLLIITILFGQMLSHYNNLTKGVTSRSLKAVLENMLADLDSAKKNISGLQKDTKSLEQEGSLHIQKVGLLRFNPFRDTGGDQSFILALLDSYDSGVVVSGLYSRSGTRWYAKRVDKGKGVDHNLSDDEKKAIKEAKRSN